MSNHSRGQVKLDQLPPEVPNHRVLRMTLKPIEGLSHQTKSPWAPAQWHRSHLDRGERRGAARAATFISIYIYVCVYIVCVHYVHYYCYCV